MLYSNIGNSVAYQDFQYLSKPVADIFEFSTSLSFGSSLVVP